MATLRAKKGGRGSKYSTGTEKRMEEEKKEKKGGTTYLSAKKKGREIIRPRPEGRGRGGI